MKTVKELESLLNVSKVSIYTMLKKDELKGHVFKGENNITLIDDIGVELLKSRFSREQDEKPKDIYDFEDVEEDDVSHSKEPSKDDTEVNNLEIIRILQEQLKIKDEQINHLLNIVINHQKLQATKLLTENQELTNDTIHTIQTEEPPKRGFFRRIFRKK